MREPSVTTMTSTSSCGQLCVIAAMCPTSSDEKYMPRARRKTEPNLRHARPTVGVYTMGASSSRWSSRMRK
jgi:hypothetical protein